MTLVVCAAEGLTSPRDEVEDVGLRRDSASYGRSRLAPRILLGAVPLDSTRVPSWIEEVQSGYDTGWWVMTATSSHGICFVVGLWYEQFVFPHLPVLPFSI